MQCFKEVFRQETERLLVNSVEHEEMHREEMCVCVCVCVLTAVRALFSPRSWAEGEGQDSCSSICLSLSFSVVSMHRADFMVVWTGNKHVKKKLAPFQIYIRWTNHLQIWFWFSHLHAWFIKHNLFEIWGSIHMNHMSGSKMCILEVSLSHHSRSVKAALASTWKLAQMQISDLKRYL